MQQARPLKKVSKVTKRKIVDINTGEIKKEEDIIALNDLPKGLD